MRNESSSIDFRQSRSAESRDDRGLDDRLDDGASIGDALGRLLSASEQVLIDQIDLTRLEVEQALNRLRDDAETTVSRVTRGAVLLGSGVALAVGGWFMLMAALIVALDGTLSRPASTALVAGANLLLALVLGRAGLGVTRVGGREAARARD